MGKVGKINEKFVDIQTSSGREVYLSHDPKDYIGGVSFYSKEIQYLLDNGNIVTLFCSFDETVSLYHSNGKFDIGLGEKEGVRKAAMSLLTSGGQCLKYMDLHENHEDYKSNMQVYIFYRNGIKTKEIDIKDLETKEDGFLNFLIQNVLTAIRTN